MQALQEIAKDRDMGEGRKTGVLPTNNVYLNVDYPDPYETFDLGIADSARILKQIPLQLPIKKTGQEGVSYIQKDEVAVLDVIASNIKDRPVILCRDLPSGKDVRLARLHGIGRPRPSHRACQITERTRTLRLWFRPSRHRDPVRQLHEQIPMG